VPSRQYGHEAQRALKAMTVLCAEFSPSGEHLVCATDRGWVHVWLFGKQIAPDGLQPPKISSSTQLHECAIYSIIFLHSGAGELLISGSDDDIRCWRWEDLVGNTVKPTPLFQLHNPRRNLRRGGMLPLSETSALAIDASSSKMYSAAGDGNAYAWDLVTQKCLSTFSGHTDMLHCLALRSRQMQLVTGSEDGTLRIWDVRSSTCSNVLRADAPPLCPGTNMPTRNPVETCGWCSCLAIDDSQNWLAAGWGNRFLCTIELNTLTCLACLPVTAPPQAVCFQPGVDSQGVLSVGAETALYNWCITGELQTRATVSCASAFALAARNLGGCDCLVAVGGVGNMMDVFCDMSHPAFSLAVPHTT